MHVTLLILASIAAFARCDDKWPLDTVIWLRSVPRGTIVQDAFRAYDTAASVLNFYASKGYKITHYTHYDGVYTWLLAAPEQSVPISRYPVIVTGGASPGVGISVQ